MSVRLTGVSGRVLFAGGTLSSVFANRQFDGQSGSCERGNGLDFCSIMGDPVVLLREGSVKFHVFRGSPVEMGRANGSLDLARSRLDEWLT